MFLLGDLLKIIGIGDDIGDLLGIGDWIGYMVEML
jgi:hypothetical protein